jgi:hypothetical protein
MCPAVSVQDHCDGLESVTQLTQRRPRFPKPTGTRPRTAFAPYSSQYPSMLAVSILAHRVRLDVLPDPGFLATDLPSRSTRSARDRGETEDGLMDRKERSYLSSAASSASTHRVGAHRAARMMSLDLRSLRMLVSTWCRMSKCGKECRDCSVKL